MAQSEQLAKWEGLSMMPRGSSIIAQGDPATLPVTLLEHGLVGA
jgi:hypothetical protein